MFGNPKDPNGLYHALSLEENVAPLDQSHGTYFPNTQWGSFDYGFDQRSEKPTVPAVGNIWYPTPPATLPCHSPAAVSTDRDAHVNPVRRSPDLTIHPWFKYRPSLHTRSSPSSSAPLPSFATTREETSPAADQPSPSPDISAKSIDKARSRVPHTLVERRYRTHLNDAIQSLRMAVPALTADAKPWHRTTARDIAGGDGPSGSRPPAAHTHSKATIISEAENYIYQLETENARLHALARRLEAQLVETQQGVRCDSCSVLRYADSFRPAAAFDSTPLAPFPPGPPQGHV